MKNFEEKSRESYNKKAYDYDNTFEGRFTERFKELLLEEIPIKTGDTVLDVACGNGRLLKLLSDRYFIKCYGIDISDKMIESAKAYCPNAYFHVSGCEKTGYKDQMFDVISVCAAYHHFPDVKGFAKEAARIIKPQGIIYIAEVSYPFLLRILLNPFFPLSKAGDVKIYSQKAIIDNFREYGFQMVRYRREGHIQIVGLKKSDK